MSAPSEDSSESLQPCPECGVMLDVSAHEPFTRTPCGSCGREIHVRTSFHHFLITREVGLGGMSRVFGARDESLGRDLALKILSPSCSRDSKRLRQFEKEAEITASISHPNVVKVYTAGRDQGYFYIAMELVEGGSLDEQIRKSGRLDEGWVLELADHVVQGLKAAGDAGLIHRDIKPGNILLTRDGTPKIVDFGLAVFARDGVEDSEIWATPFYVPPETLHGEPEDFRSDIYALGSTLYHALVGKPLFDNDTNSLVELRTLKSKPADLREAATVVSAETVAILTRALKRRPAERYESYGEFLDHLRYARRRLKRGGRGAPWPGRPPLSPGQRFGAAAAVALLLGGVWLAARPGKPHPGHPDAPLLTGTDSSSGTDSTVSSKFINARNLLFSGDFLKSRDLFDALGEDAATLQPTRNWARYQAGLASLLAADVQGARTRFGVMRRGGPYSTAPEDAALAAFFTDSAAALEDSLPVAGVRAREFPADSAQAIGLLAIALKNWHLGDLANASAFLRAFEASRPPRTAAWVDKYKAVAQPYLADIRVIDSLPSLPLAAKTPEEARTVLEQARTTAGKLTATAGPAAEAARLRIADLTMAANDLEARLNGVLRGQVAEEVNQMLAAETAAAPLIARMDFDGMAARLRALKPTTTAAREVLEDRRRLWENAASFIDLLRHDLAQPIEAELVRVSGAVLRGQVSDSTDGLWIKTSPTADTTLALADITPASLTVLAEKILERTADSDQYYLRREMLVAFALRTGLRNYAALSGRELARENRAFRARWTRLQASGLLN
ncbi:MAG: serine/threonine-protein kinase [Verrucomicrobiota bacterium]